jgi:hypothetical protein
VSEGFPHVSRLGNSYVFDLVTGATTGWRAYIRQQPSYGLRSPDLSLTHRIRDADGWSVCWDRPLTRREDLEVVVKLWAECTDHYLLTGRFAECPGGCVSPGGP